MTMIGRVLTFLAVLATTRAACDITCTLTGVDSNIIQVDHGALRTANEHRCFATESQGCKCLCDEDWSTVTTTATSALSAGSLSTSHPGHVNNLPVAAAVVTAFPVSGSATINGVSVAEAQTNAFQNAFVAGLCAQIQLDMSSFMCSSISITGVSGVRRRLVRASTSASITIEYTIYTTSSANVDTLANAPIDTAAVVQSVEEAYTGTADLASLTVAPTNTCTCPGGTPVTSMLCSPTNQCASCGANYHLSSGSCVADSCTGQEVTCRFTIDNSVWKVYYNDQDITSTVTGNLHSWTAAKTVNFTPVAGAALSISGYEWTTSGGQGQEHTSGLLITCSQGSATDIIYGHSSDWNWHSFSSDDNEGDECSSAHGGNAAGCRYPTEASFATDWYKANGPSGVSPTVSNSAFSMTSAGYSEKIWDGGKRFGAFRVATPADVCYPAAPPSPSSWTKHTDKACSGRNELAGQNGITVEDAKAWCESESTCVSFERMPTAGQFQFSTTCDSSVMAAYNNHDLYVYDRPAP